MPKDALFQCTVLFDANYKSIADIVINQGGTYSGKTWSILQVLLLTAATAKKKNFTITVAGESVPNLKGGAYKQALEILADSPFLQYHLTFHNKTDRVLLFKNGAIVEFKSYENEQQARGGKRDILFVNEANWMAWEIFQQLVTRTDKTFIDYNPAAPFWAHEKLIGTVDRNNELGLTVQFIRSWHVHNPFISEAKHRQIENNTDPDWHRVYARGLTGNLEGIIYPNWVVIPDQQFHDLLKLEDNKFFGGIDFGYTIDPTAGYKMFKSADSLYIHELFYESGNIPAPIIKQHLFANGWEKNRQILYCERDPDMTLQLRGLGIRTMPANKNPGSLKAGIEMVKQFKVFVTASSKNIIEERKRYMWEKDEETGKLTNVPIDKYNHGMDAVRYGCYTHFWKNRSGRKSGV